MNYKIEISHKQHIKDIKAEETEKDILDLGLKGIEEVKSILLYEIDGDFTVKEITGICKNLLIDGITQDFKVFPLEKTTNQKNICPASKKKSNQWLVEVWFKKGVTDTVGETVKKGIRDLGLKNEVNRVKTGCKYILKGNLAKAGIEKITTSLLANKVVQEYEIVNSNKQSIVDSP